ncbi:MAG: aminotransferase class I/II-fold pyridoxal phosphate-dependent enzyme [Verrucomicrobiota bacterium]|nr:aminotransferase class I/II-fold pyridoxal phosphate-dependent enzyme [Verrucomicrobiota bacterium]
MSSNENPYGPSKAALQAMTDSFGAAWRYPDELNDVLISALAKLNGVAHDQILLGDGSSEVLELCAVAFTGRDHRPLIAADPTFEALGKLAAAKGAEIVKVPLTSTFAHDLGAMSSAAAKGGLVYICNPNNPTASITPKDELREFIQSVPADTMILVDEAYFHFADSPEYESVIPMINDHPNLIVARTFSKIYGMAGLRCGYCIAQKEVITRMQAHQSWDSVNVMALAAAIESLKDEAQVTNGRRLNSEVKAYTLKELDSLGYASIPSQANFIMFDAKKPVVPLIAAMKERKVQVGRLFPALPNHMRVTIGKRDEMQAFVSAFREVMAA